MVPEIRGVRSEEERESVRALLRSEFEVAPGVGDAFANLYDSLLSYDPAVSADCSRVAVYEGRVVGHALLAPREIRVCDGDCPGGLIGMVVVHPDYRGRGVGSGLIDDVHRQAQDRKLGLLILAGDPGFYRRFGYHDAFTRTECSVDVGPSRADEEVLRPATLSDVNALSEISRQSVPSGAVSPSPARWEWILRTGHPAALLASNPALLGYRANEDWCLIADSELGYVRVAVGGRQATVYEAGLADDSSAVCILQALTAACHREGVADLKLRLPSQSALLKAANVDARPTVGPEFQFKVIDLDVLLGASEKGLEARIRRDFPDWVGSVLIRTESDALHLSRETGKIRFCRLRGEAAQAPTGTLTIPEWGVGRMLLGQDDVLKALEQSPDKTDLDRALKSLFTSDPPSFVLADAI
jgi:predicted N-acetyltransferase YhbS